MKATICDLCAEAITRATETHRVLYADNSAKRFDCCNQCRDAIRNGDTHKAVRFAHLLLGIP